MELRQYAALFIKWSWLIGLCVLLGGGAAYYFSSQQPPTYQATSTLLVNQASSTIQDYNAILTGERLARTYAQLLTKRPVMEQVVQDMGLNVTPESLASKVKVNLVRDTQLVTLQVIDQNPQLAVNLANKIPVVFSQKSEELQMGRYASSKGNPLEQMNIVSADIAEGEEALTALRAASTPDRAEIARVTEQILQYRTTYASLLKSYEEIRVVEAKTLDTVTLVEPVSLPSSPVGPKTTTNTFLAAVVGAMLAIGVVFLVEYLDDTVKTDTEASALLGLPTIGAIVHFGGKDDPALVVDKPRSSTLEAYRSFRTNIRFSSPDRQPKTIMVTSPGQGEGKTCTVANRAAVFAKAGFSTVVVDADLRKPQQHKVFKLKRSEGLTNMLVLDDPSRWNGCLKGSGVPNLRLRPRGPLPPNPAEFLASERMTEMVEQLSKEADIVMFDTPPCLAVSDAGALVSKVDGILLVVEAGKTRREAALRAKESLEQVGGRILGVVLTKIPVRRLGYGYYYHYYSRHYEYGQSSGADADPKDHPPAHAEKNHSQS